MFAGLIFATWACANGVGDRLEPVFERPSPSLLMGERHVNLEERHGRRVKTESATSFPSNHGSVFFTVFFMCLLRWGVTLPRHWPVWLCLFIIVTLLSTPRAFTGAHWMSDTLIGSVLVTWLTAAMVMHTPVWAFYQRVEERIVRATDLYLAGRGRAAAQRH